MPHQECSTVWSIRLHEQPRHQMSPFIRKQRGIKSIFAFFFPLFRIRWGYKCEMLLYCHQLDPYHEILLCVVINVLTDVNCQLQPIFWLIFAPCYSINSIADSRQKKPVSIISNPFVYSKVLYVLAVMMLRTNG